MKRAYTVGFASPDRVGIDRIRNFAEDLYRALRADGLGDVPNEASATDTVEVHVSAPRHLSRVLQAIRLQLRRHNLETDAAVARTND